jgi:hypothetical protein
VSRKGRNLEGFIDLTGTISSGSGSIAQFWNPDTADSFYPYIPDPQYWLLERRGAIGRRRGGMVAVKSLVQMFTLDYRELILKPFRN